jgi:hypothetical protein
MKRFVDNLPAGTPIINSDFHDILQDQHRIAYSAYYDGLNDEKYSTYSTDRGIIIKGCEVTNATLTSTPNTFNYTIDFTDSLVYFDGQFCEPNQNNTTISNTSGFYLYPVTQSRVVNFRDGTTQSIAINYKFDYGITEPSNGLPYILFQFGGTARRLSRLLRLSSAVKDDILISSNVVEIGGVWRDFNLTTGLGRNEMKGFRILTEMGGRFMVGYNGLSSSTPINAGLLEFNYGTPSNYGGTHSLTFSKAQLPAHNHGGSTATTSNNLDHSHPLQYGQDSFDKPQPENPSVGNLIYYGLQIDENLPIEEINLLTRQVPLYSPSFSSNDNQIGLENSDITTHTHPINIAGSDIPHENRPPYRVVLYYTKI